MRKGLAALTAGMVLAGCSAGNPKATGTKIYIQQRDYENAERAALEWVESEPASGEPHLWLALIHMQDTAGYSRAAEDIIKALEVDNSLYEEARFNGATKLGGQTLLVDTIALVVLQNAGVEAMNAKKNDAAVRYFQKAHSFRPEMPRPLLLLASLQQTMGKLEEARRSLEKALLVAPDDPKVKYHLALYLSSEESYDSAITLLTAAIEEDSAYAKAYEERGFSRFALATGFEGDTAKKARMMELYGKAADDFEQAILLDSSLTQARLNLGISWVKMRKMEEAVAAFEGYTALVKDSYKGWFLLSAARFEVAEPKDGKKWDRELLEKALAANESAIEIEPEVYEAWNLKGNILKQLGRKKEALKAFRVALELSKG